jgi:hypothetical protein
MSDKMPKEVWMSLTRWSVEQHYSDQVRYVRADLVPDQEQKAENKAAAVEMIPGGNDYKQEFDDLMSGIRERLEIKEHEEMLVWGGWQAAVKMLRAKIRP